MVQAQLNHDCREELNGLNLRATPARIAIKSASRWDIQSGRASLPTVFTGWTCEDES